MANDRSRRVGHEVRDVNARGVIWFAIGLTIAGIIVYLALAGLFGLFKKQHPSPDPPSRIVLEPHVLAPEPRLQPNPIPDLDRFRESEQRKLNSYGWTDKQRGIVHIPIERAMDLIAQRGLPTRGPGVQNNSGKTPEQMRQEKANAPSPQRAEK